MDRLEELKSYSKRLLDKNLNDRELESTVEALSVFFEDFSEVKSQQNKKYDEHSNLLNGTAISPHGAAKCILDPLRVSYFLRGIYKAINDALKKYPKPLHILYAGSGPYATLLTPLLSYFSIDEIEVTILDYHEVSLKSVKNILNALSLDGYIKNYIQADASKYTHPKDDPIHIAVIETMTAALEKEMQVAITLNITPQLHENGILIPQKITIKGMFLSIEEAFIDIGSNSTWKDYQDIGILFEIDKQNGIELSKYKDKPFLMANKVIFPQNIKKDKHPFLITQISIYDDIKMFGYQCSLNHPVLFPDFGSYQATSTVEFIYSLGKRPGLAIKTT